MFLFYKTICLMLGVFAVGFVAGLLLPLQVVAVIEALFLVIVVCFVFICK